MASGAVLRWKKVISDHLNVSAHYCNFIRNLGHGHSTELRTFTSFTHNQKNDTAAVMVNWGFLKLRLLSGHGNCKLEFTRTSSQFIRYASTNTQPNLVDECNEEELAAKKIKESPSQNCDQAVEGWSGNRLQDYYNEVLTAIHRVRSTISDIDRTLKLLACRNILRLPNCDQTYDYIDWKDIFISILGRHHRTIYLLSACVSITLRLLVKISRGKSLSKRERQLLTHSTADLFLLVPASTYIVVPFIEFMLPVFLRLFPSMLPPTSQDKKKEQEAPKRKVKARSEFAIFLQDTAKVMTKLDVKYTAQDYDRFVSDFSDGLPVSKEKILCFAKLFNDELTLDNISRPQLVTMCKYTGIPPCGTDEYLRFMLRKRLRSIKKNDNLIKAKGVESLSEAELCKYCRERGFHTVEDIHEQFIDIMPVSEKNLLYYAKLFNDDPTLDNIRRYNLVGTCRCVGILPCGTDDYLRFMLRKKLKLIKKDDNLIKAKGVESLSEAEICEYCGERGIHSVEEMQQQLHDWLDLSLNLNHYVPSSLLILSRAFTVIGKSKPEEAVLAAISSLPCVLIYIAGAKALPYPVPGHDKHRRCESLQIQEKAIKEEEAKENVISEMKQSDATQDDLALKEMTIPTENGTPEQARQYAVNKQEKLCEIGHANAVFASALSVIQDCEKLSMLVKKEINLFNSIQDKEGAYGKIKNMKADKAVQEENDQDAELNIGDKVLPILTNKVLPILTNKADAMLERLEKEIDDVDAKIGYHWSGLDRYRDGTVSPEVAAAAALYLKETMGEERIQKLMSNLSKYKGDIVKLGIGENVNVYDSF